MQSWGKALGSRGVGRMARPRGVFRGVALWVPRTAESWMGAVALLPGEMGLWLLSHPCRLSSSKTKGLGSSCVGPQRWAGAGDWVWQGGRSWVQSEGGWELGVALAPGLPAWIPHGGGCV